MSSESRRKSKQLFIYKPKTFLVANMETLGQFLDTVLSTFSPYDDHDAFYNAVLPYQNMVLIIKHPTTRKVILKGRCWFRVTGKLTKSASLGYDLNLYLINTEDMVNTTDMSNPSNPNRDLEAKAHIKILQEYDIIKKTYTFFNPDYTIYPTAGNKNERIGIEEIKKDYPIELYREPTPDERAEAIMNRKMAQADFNIRPGGPEYRLLQARKNEEGQFIRDSGVSSFRTRSMPTKSKSKSKSKSKTTSNRSRLRSPSKGKKQLVTRSAELPKRNRAISRKKNSRINRSPVVLSPPKPLEFPQEDIDAFLIECNKSRGNVIPFLNQGLDPNLRNEENEPVLSIALKRGNIPVVKQLLQNGADINAKDDLGNTPFMNAIITLYIDLNALGLLDLMRTLARSGPNLKLTNNAGNSVADLLNIRINRSQDSRKQAWKYLKNVILNNNAL